MFSDDSEIYCPPPMIVQPLDEHRFSGCSKIDNYDSMKKLGEGTFGIVKMAEDVRTHELFALKKIIVHNEKDGFPLTALREIRLLKLLNHDNIIQLREIAIQRPQGEQLRRAIHHMVTPYMDHDLAGLIENRDVHLTDSVTKCYVMQMLKGLAYLHSQKIMHRDMKSANMLINNAGRLRLADFGLARTYDEPAPQRGRGNGSGGRQYTALVVTRWYRAPELFMALRQYTPAIDLWGVGCILAEIFLRRPVMKGSTDMEQLRLIFELVGSPTPDRMPGFERLPAANEIRAFPTYPGKMEQLFSNRKPTELAFMKDLLNLDWRARLNAMDAMEHRYFRDSPLPARESSIPAFPSSHEIDNRNAQVQAPPAPPGGSAAHGRNGGHWQPNGRGGHRNDGDHPRRGYDNREPIPYAHPYNARPMMHRNDAGTRNAPSWGETASQNGNHRFPPQMQADRSRGNRSNRPYNHDGGHGHPFNGHRGPHESGNAHTAGNGRMYRDRCDRGRDAPPTGQRMSRSRSPAGPPRRITRDPRR